MLSSRVEPSMGLCWMSSGAPIPAVAIEIRSIQTQLAWKTQADSAGVFTAPGILPGMYEVSASADGFQTESRSKLELSIGRTIAIQFVLRPGRRQDSLTVEGRAEQEVESGTSLFNEALTSRAISDLPLNGRNFLGLLALTAGVQPNTYNGNTPAFFNINGGRDAGNSFLIDGLDVNSPSADSIRTLPDLESLEEFQIITSTFTAEHGRAVGGVINTHIRGGTDKLHGSLFEYFRNDHMDARGFFDESKPKYRFNQFGGSLGGPLIRKKLFAFGSYQGTRSRSASTVATTLPSQAEAGGNFRELLPRTVIYDPIRSREFISEQRDSPQPDGCTFSSDVRASARAKFTRPFQLCEAVSPDRK